MAKRGLGSPKVSPEQRRRMAQIGGRAAQQSGKAHRWDSESGAAASQIAVMNYQRKQVEVRYGQQTAREHALIQAHRWQLQHMEDVPLPDAYPIIVDLLGLVPYGELQAAIQKSDAAGKP
jgi:hypothetical protein